MEVAEEAEAIKRSIEKIAAFKALLWSITQVIWLRVRILKWRWGLVKWERYRLWRLLWSKGRSAGREPSLTRPFGTASSVPEKDNCPVDNPKPSLPMLINATSTKQISGMWKMNSHQLVDILKKCALNWFQFVQVITEMLELSKEAIY